MRSLARAAAIHGHYVIMQQRPRVKHFHRQQLAELFPHRRRPLHRITAEAPGAGISRHQITARDLTQMRRQLPPLQLQLRCNHRQYFRNQLLVMIFKTHFLPFRNGSIFCSAWCGSDVVDNVDRTRTSPHDRQGIATGTVAPLFKPAPCTLHPYFS